MKRLIFFSLFWLFSAASAFGASLHGFLVIDTFADLLQEATKADYRNLSTILGEAASQTGLTYRETLLTGSDLSKKNIVKTLSRLEIGPDDAVVFYFTGHGYRTPGKKDPWPFLLLTYDRKGIDFHTLSNLLIQKNPRFLLAIAECCNNYISYLSPFSEFSRKSHKKKRVKKNFHKLFLETDAWILVSSSTQGEYAWAYPTKGSLFSLRFLNVIRKEVKYHNDTDWGVILEESKKGLLNDQKPFYEMIPSR